MSLPTGVHFVPRDWEPTEYFPSVIPVSDIAPASTFKVWLDTSTVPAIFKAWDGASWVAIIASGESDAGVASAITSGTQTQAAGDARWVKWSATGHIGIEKSDPQNARIYIGSGTGTVTDNGVMGVKVKIDTPVGSRTDGIQANVKAVAGAGSGAIRALLGRVDVADTTTGDTVALWGDVFVTTASARNTWGLNTYVSVDAASGYTGVLVGAEIAVMNDSPTASADGGILHLVATGSQMQRFGMKVGGSSGTFNIEHSVLLSSTTPPSTNAFYYGPLGVGNIPTGTPLFQINAAGSVGIGMAAQSDAVLAVAGRVKLGTTSGPLLVSGAGTPEGAVTAGVGSLFLRTDGGAGTTLYVKQSGTGNTGWVAK